ncbi:MAG: hypothetical protein HQK49_17545 [Oligoflexia bacterium]|nr:hypothetical protein [Oligoflexia bacterium]
MNVKKIIKEKILFISIVCFFFVIVSCSDKKEPPESRFTTLYNGTFKPNCLSCHAPGNDVYDNSGVKLDFTTKELAYSTLTTKNSASPSNQYCRDIPYASARDVNNSYLLAVLISTYNTTNYASKVNCVPYNVHLLDQNLSQTEKDSIVAWINEGAGI